MRYSYAALVLATASIGQVLAGPVRHGHAHFHAKKDAAALKVEEAEVDKRDAQLADVNWATVAYTFSAGQTWGKSTAAAPAVAVATPTKAAVAAPAATTATNSASAVPASAVGIDSTTVLLTTDASKLTSMGFKACGANAVTNNGGVWIGTDGPYTNEFINSAGEDIILVIWGSWGSWVNAAQPLITHSLASGASTTISFASGAVGAWSAIYEDIELVNGQVSNTWGEYTFSEEGVVDVSREVNMNGHSMSIVGPQCTTDMEQCVFVCSEGTVCTTGYELKNCENGSQPGANYGMYDGSPSGGCGGLGSAAALKTTFS